MNKDKILPALIISGLLIGVLLWYASPPKVENAHHEHDHEEETVVPLSDEQITKLQIPVATAAPGSLNVVLATRGKIILHPDRLAHILPKVSGIAQEIKKNIGDPVQQNDVLTILESREMADIKASYLASLEKEKLAKSLLDREQALNEKKVSAKQDLINAQAVYQEAKIQTELNKQKLHAFGFANEEIENLSQAGSPDLRFYEIRSPINGTVIARHITKGEYIESTATIFEIADLSKVWVEIGIYPKDLQKVAEGQLVDITLPSESLSQKAKIIYLSPIIQDETINAKAIVELDNPEKKWKPGSFVKAAIAIQTLPGSVIVSKDAIQHMDGNDVVFVKIPEGFEKRIVQTGLSDDDNIEILSGLSIGESYADAKTFILKADLKKSGAEHE